MPVALLSMAMTKYLVVGVVAATAVGGTAAVVAATGSTVVVERVVDGDTFDATVDGRSGVRIRLLNIDTPETKDPNMPVECLGPQASARLAELVPAGSEVTLEGDVEPTDRYGRTLSGVTNADGVLVNAELAREGLGVPMVVEPNRRFYDEVVAAQQEAKAAARGLYSPTIDCTVPAPVAQVEQLTIPTAGPALVADQWDAAAERSDQVVDRATAVLAMFDGPRTGIVWTAFTRVEQDAFRARVQVVLDRAAGEAVSSRGTATTMREAAVAQEQARRDDEERQRNEARAAARAQAAYEADLAAARRRQAAADSSSSSSGRSSGSSSASSGSGAYPGYTGPRCYEPGGRTYHPC